MSRSAYLRMRAARYYASTLARADRRWEAGDEQGASALLDAPWPQIEAQQSWLRRRPAADAEARVVLGEYSLAGRRVLGLRLLPLDRKIWFESTLGSEHAPEVRVASLLQLAICWVDLGDSGRALEYAERALQLAREFESSQLVPDALRALGYAQGDAGRNREAAETLRSCLSLRVERLGATHLDPLEDACALAAVYEDLGESRKIVEILEPVVETIERTPRLQAPRLTGGYRILGVALCYQQDLGRAERLCERALELDQRFLSPGHPRLAIDLNDLAIVLQRSGKLDRARECMQEALRIDRERLGEEHPHLGLRWANLGTLWRLLGEPRKAQDALERALGILRRSRGEPHLHLAHCLRQLGRVQAELGQFPGAIDSLERAIRMHRELGGDQGELLEDDLHELAVVRSRAATDPFG